MLTSELKERLLEVATVRLAGHPPELREFNRQLHAGLLPVQSTLQLSLTSTGLSWVAVDGFANRQILAFVDAWFRNSNPTQPLPIGADHNGNVEKTPTPRPMSDAVLPECATIEPWIGNARRMANQYIDAWRNAGYEPTRKDAALYIEGEFSTQNMVGSRGTWLSSTYIERHALKGITGRPPGSKIKGKKIPEGERGNLPKNKEALPN